MTFEIDRKDVPDGLTEEPTAKYQTLNTTEKGE
jgi:hypothetical protein